MSLQPLPLVLASSSSIRRKILSSAGLDFTSISPPVDEAEIKAKNLHFTPTKLVEVLAEAKALSAKVCKQTLVIGADQVLEVDGEALDKVKNMEQAKQRLWSLRGREHFLIGSCVLVQNKNTLWKYSYQSRLKMRKFSERALDSVLEKTGEKTLSSVGCYLLEGQSIQLFEEIDADFSAMLGLPIIPVLAALRKFGGLGS